MLSQLKKTLAQLLSSQIELGEEEILPLLKLPKSLDHGHLAYPVFPLAKARKEAPPLLAKKLADDISSQLPEFLKQVEAVGGFLNFHFSQSYVQNLLFNSYQGQGHQLGWSDQGKGRTMVLEFGSPNVAKPMHLGHFRALMIGKAIYNLALTQGYTVIALNHLGDWGVQFGKLIWAYEQWKDEYDFAKAPFDSLYALYVRFHEEAEKHPELEDQGRSCFKRLEEGDAEYQKIWKSFVDISMEEYKRLFDLLNVHHDLNLGESFYADRVEDLENRLKKLGIMIEDQGAQVVRLDEEDLPPCIIRKSDGATIYATRDLASAIYRAEELKAQDLIYLTGSEQDMHFKQVFSVLHKMKFSWAEDCRHFSFGIYRFKDAKMSSRKGTALKLNDLVNESIRRAEQTIGEKNPELPNRFEVARQVGIGAIIFNDLVNDRVKNVEFDWERALNFEGDSGPYVQYCQVRCLSLLRKYGVESPLGFDQDLESDEERGLVRHLLLYEDTLNAAFNNYKPHILAGYLLETCQRFNHFYHKHRILSGEEHLIRSRMTLVSLTQKGLQQGLAVLNIESPQFM